MFTLEDEIITGIKEREETAATRLYNKFKDKFIREGIYKYRLTNDELNEAYDNTMLAVIENIQNGKYEPLPGKKLENYIAGILHNKCIDIYRKKQSPNESLFDKLPELARKSLEEKFDLQHLELKIEQCYKKIGESCKKVLMLAIGGYKDKEIAEQMLYKSEDVAKQKRFNCRNKLRHCLKLSNNE